MTNQLSMKPAIKKGMSIKESIREGYPTEELFRAVKEEDIDLLIMLAHEEGHLEHFLFGRSNEEIIRKMPCCSPGEERIRTRNILMRFLWEE